MSWVDCKHILYTGIYDAQDILYGRTIMLYTLNAIFKRSWLSNAIFLLGLSVLNHNVLNQNQGNDIFLTWNLSSKVYGKYEKGK